MLRVRLEVEGASAAADAFAEVAERFREGPGDVVREIAERWVSEVFPGVLDRGDPSWPPLSAVSIKLRGPSRPLQGEGILRESFRIEEISATTAVIGNEFGAVHQLGGRTSPDSMIPDKEIPARPFLVLIEAEADEDARRIFGHYLGGEA